MKKLRFLIAVLALVLLPMIAQAASFTFTPYDNDVFDLDHNYLYIWGIKPTLPSDEVITSATVTIKDINNWDNYTNILKFYLVDNPKINDTTATTVDIISLSDNQGTSGSNELPYYKGTRFTDFITLNTTFVDTNKTTQVDQFSYSFNKSEIGYLSQYLATANPFIHTTSPLTYKNATFGLGFDPDCHYYNNGIKFTIETRPVPEPATMLLLGLGLVGLAGVGRKFRR